MSSTRLIDFVCKVIFLWWNCRIPGVALVIVLCMMWLIVWVFCDVALLQWREAGHMISAIQVQRVARFLKNSDCDNEVHLRKWQHFPVLCTERLWPSFITVQGAKARPLESRHKMMKSRCGGAFQDPWCCPISEKNSSLIVPVATRFPKLSLLLFSSLSPCWTHGSLSRDTDCFTVKYIEER